MRDVTPPRLLAVFAHPDDETFLAGGTLARHAAAGWDVRLITCTRGEAGRRGPYVDLSQEEFGALREAELRHACAALGVLTLQVLGLPDQGVALREAEATEAIADVVETWGPALVLTFGPDGISGHADHVAVSRVVTAVVQRAAERIRRASLAATSAPSLYYVSRSPGVPGCCAPRDTAPPPPVTTVVDVTAALNDKVRAVAAYRSQAHLQHDAMQPTPDALIGEMFHRAIPSWSAPEAEAVRLLP